ncbi:hypothetical protein HGRIS_012386 [Hohenbuehelia grisea]|uniref:F-box domain-containing protein n=1 Tax=Hohenbuehelia grisea TaxID=104357 RepID=A0ABR3IS99_9AGAR
MHSCLSVDEIFRNIVDQIPVTDGQCTLASLAQTCRAFKDPSLARLWSQLSTILPLLKLFPEDAWEIADDHVPVLVSGSDSESLSESDQSFNSTGRTFKFVRDLFPERDWSRFNAYAPLVHHLTFALHLFESCNGVKIPRLVLDNLSLHKPESPLLPRLRSLAWDDEVEFAAPVFQLFLSPFVTHLSYTNRRNSARPPNGSRPSSILSTLATSCPDLVSFKARNLPQDVLVTVLLPRTVTSESAARFASLKFLSISGNDIPQAVLMDLSNHAQLEYLVCTIGETSIPHSTTSTSFASLRKLSMSIRRLTSEVSNYVRCLRLPQLAELRLHLPSRRVDLAWLHHLCQSISTYTTLSILCIGTYGGQTNSPVFASDIHPLLDIRGLRELQILIQALRLDDDAITSISTSFPALRRLELIPRQYRTRGSWQTRCTLASLKSLSRNCRHLKELAILLDTKDASSVSLNDNDADRIRNTELTQIWVGNSDPPDPKATAVVLADLFPNLMAIEPRGRLNNGTNRPDRWRVVERLLLRSHAGVSSQDGDGGS